LVDQFIYFFNFFNIHNFILSSQNDALLFERPSFVFFSKLLQGKKVLIGGSLTRSSTVM